MGTSVNIRRANQPPGLLGLFVLSFGWLFSPLFLALLTAPLIRFFDMYITRRTGCVRNACFASFLFAAVLFMRGSTGGVYFLFFNVILTIIISFTHSIFSKALKVKY